MCSPEDFSTIHLLSRSKLHIESYWEGESKLVSEISSRQMEVIVAFLVPWLTSALGPSVLLFLCSPRATVWLPHEGVAVFLHFHRAFVRPPLIHLPVTNCRGRRASEDLAERDLPQETLLWVQGELRQQHKFFTCAETLVQKAAEGPAHITFIFPHVCNDWNNSWLQVATERYILMEMSSFVW